MAMATASPLEPQLEKLAEVLVDCAFVVHSELGPGLLESTYEKCLAWELASRGLNAERQLILPIEYRGQRIDDGFRIDLLVERQIIIEVKACKDADPIFRRQLITYLKLSKLRLGFLINFNKILIRDGIDRILV
jgi:GxxExxY protein